MKWVYMKVGISCARENFELKISYFKLAVARSFIVGVLEYAGSEPATKRGPVRLRRYTYQNVIFHLLFFLASSLDTEPP